MELSIFMTLLPPYFAKGISRTRFAAKFKKWKQRKLHTMLSLSIMEKKRITAIFTHCAYDTNYASGLPP